MKDLKLKENEIVHCENEEQAKKVLQIAHDFGYKWCTGESYMDDIKFYNKYNGGTLYFINEGKNSDTSYICIKHAIITAKQFLKRHDKPLTLENVQVDCSELSRGSVNKAFDVYLKNGFKYWKSEEIAKNFHAGQCTILGSNESKEVLLFSPQQSRVIEDNIVSYEKFMELFGEKESKSGWYIYEDNPNYIAYHNFETKKKFGVGALGLEMINIDTLSNCFKDYTKATHETVLKRLTEHATKLGFVKGAVFKHNNLNIECADADFNLKDNVFYYGEFPIMKDGVWAEIVKVNAVEEKPTQYQIGIDTFTRSEANMTKDEIMACVKFGIDKYNWRKKDQDKEDLEKIISYAQWGLKNIGNE